MELKVLLRDHEAASPAGLARGISGWIERYHGFAHRSARNIDDAHAERGRRKRRRRAGKSQGDKDVTHHRVGLKRKR
jgi:hypothetical protein